MARHSISENAKAEWNEYRNKEREGTKAHAGLSP